MSTSSPSLDYLNTVTPITIRHVQTSIIDKSNGVPYIFHLDGDKLGIVRLVGLTGSTFKNKHGRITLSINDGTGIMFGFLFISNNDTPDIKVLVAEENEDCMDTDIDRDNVKHKLKVNTYYIVHARLRWITKKMGTPSSHIYMDVLNMEEVVDFNIITYHNLECIHNHLQKTRSTEKMSEEQFQLEEFAADFN